MKTISYRTSHGTMVLKLQQEAILTIVNWKGVKKRMFLDIGSFLYFQTSSFVKKGQLIAEYSMQTSSPGSRRLKPIYTSIAGEIKFENLLVRKMPRDKRTVKVNQEDGVLWVASGKIFPVPKEIKYLFPKVLKKTKPFALLKLVTPFQGIILLKQDSITLITKKNQISLELSNIKKVLQNCSIKISSIVKNYQYVDKHTILSFIEIFPNCEGMVYSVRKKPTRYISTLFLITEEDVWKINTDQINNFSFFQKKKTIVRSQNLLNSNAKFSRSGFFLKKDGFKMIFQTAVPIFLSRGTILNYKQGDFVLEKKIFAMLVNYTQQTEDIVQGLPKIEELVEARRPKLKSYLSYRPGILLDAKANYQETVFTNSIIQCIHDPKNPIDSIVGEKKPKQLVSLGHSIYLKDEIVIYEDKVFKAIPIPSSFYPNEEESGKSNEFTFRNPFETERTDKRYTSLGKKRKSKKQEILLINHKPCFSIWDLKTPKENFIIYGYKQNQLFQWATVNQKDAFSLFENEKKDLIIKTKEFEYLFLEYLQPLIQYEIPLTSKILFQEGDFIDIGEPITEGSIDVHELLNILFTYHSILDGMMVGTSRSLYKFQLLLVNSVQAIYQSQGVSISSKHIEIIVRQMTAKVVIKQSGDTPFLPGELIRISLMNEIYYALQLNHQILKYKKPEYEPLLLSATNSSLTKDGFLSPAGFQETKRVLTKAAVEGCSDWLRGLKECIIIGRLIPAGSSFLNYKSYLDNIFLFK
jgi:hypothetical protein